MLLGTGSEIIGRGSRNCHQSQDSVTEFEPYFRHRRQNIRHRVKANTENHYNYVLYNCIVARIGRLLITIR